MDPYLISKAEGVFGNDSQAIGDLTLDLYPANATTVLQLIEVSNGLYVFLVNQTNPATYEAYEQPYYVVSITGKDVPGGIYTYTVYSPFSLFQLSKEYLEPSPFQNFIGYYIGPDEWLAHLILEDDRDDALQLVPVDALEAHQRGVRVRDAWPYLVGDVAHTFSAGIKYRRVDKETDIVAPGVQVAGLPVYPLVDLYERLVQVVIKAMTAIVVLNNSRLSNKLKNQSTKWDAPKQGLLQVIEATSRRHGKGGLNLFCGWGMEEGAEEGERRREGTRGRRNGFRGDES